LKNAESIVEELLAIPGDSGHEGAIVNAIEKRLRKAGASGDSIQRDKPPRLAGKLGECGNLVLLMPGTVAGPRRMLSAHVDTVPLARNAKPVRRGRRIVSADKSTGLGADDRAGSAVLLAVALELLRTDTPHPPLTFCWTVQEEVGLYGSRHAKLGLLGKPKMAFNFDGGAANKVTFGATGGYRMKIDVHGIASHAGVVPEKGVSAITIASLAIADLHANGWLGKIDKQGRQGTANVGVINGGEATNVITPHVHLRAEARSHDPAFRAEIIQAIEQAFEKAAAGVQNTAGECGKVAIQGTLDYEAFRLSEDEPSVLAACQAVRRWHSEPVLAVSNGGLDANWFTARGIPTVSLGCGQENAHTALERLDLTEFGRACQIALCLATGTE
jgi:tripeptide aminopeptidase